MHYILKDRKPVKVGLSEWADWFGKANRHINKTKITGEINVSTVFLGIDYSFGSDIPLLFETMIFGGEHDQYQERYATWDEAEKGHIIAVELCN